MTKISEVSVEEQIKDLESLFGEAAPLASKIVDTMQASGANPSLCLAAAVVATVSMANTVHPDQKVAYTGLWGTISLLFASNLKAMLEKPEWFHVDEGTAKQINEWIDEDNARMLARRNASYN